MNTEETHSFLNNLMDVDHVIEVLPGRRVTDRTTSGLYAPNLNDGELDSDDWALITGFSG